MSTSVYQQVRDYFISRDLFSLDMIPTHCSQKMSRDKLKKYFGENIRKHDVLKYRKKYEKECIEALTEVAKTNQVGGEFWQTRLGTALTSIGSMVYETSERVFQLDNVYSKGKWVPKLEKFLNMLAFTGSFFLPWSMFITFYPSGRKLITDLFSKPGMSSIIAFYCVLYTIRTQEGYDDYFFQEEIVRMIPYINLPKSIIKTFNMPLLIGKVVNETVIQEWYHYMTLNLVSQSSLNKATSLLDSKLTSAFLQSLANALELYINEQKDIYIQKTHEIMSELQARLQLRTRQVFRSVMTEARSGSSTLQITQTGKTRTRRRTLSGSRPETVVAVSQTTQALLTDPSPVF